MNSNPTHPEATLSQNHTLYLRLFFKHHTLTQQHAQLITTANTGLTVLQSLVQQFMEKHSIELPSHTHQQKQSPEAQVTRSIEEIYDSLKVVFEEWGHGDHNKSTRITSNTTMGSCSDEQLYEIVGEYREQLRKQKEARGKAESTVTQLRQQVGASNKSIRQLQMQLKDKEQQCTSGSKQLQQKQEQLEEMNRQFIEVSGRVEQLKLAAEEAKSTQSQLSSLKQEHQLLQQQHRSERNQRQLFEDQLAQTDNTIKQRIEEGKERWKEMVAEQLRDPNHISAVMQQPICRLMRTLAQRQQQLIEH